jgi:hypothetical protein
MRLRLPAPPRGVSPLHQEGRRRPSRVDLHVVLDNYGTHKHPEVGTWLALPANQGSPCTSPHTGCSWLNMVRELLRHHLPPGHPRGAFRPVKDLTAAIGRFIGAYNECCQPFTWTKDADELQNQTVKELMPCDTSWCQWVQECCPSTHKSSGPDGIGGSRVLAVGVSQIKRNRCAARRQPTFRATVSGSPH